MSKFGGLHDAFLSSRLLIIVLGFIFDSLALVAFALAFWIVWFVFLGAATGRWGGQRRS